MKLGLRDRARPPSRASPRKRSIIAKTPGRCRPKQGHAPPPHAPPDHRAAKSAPDPRNPSSNALWRGFPDAHAKKYDVIYADPPWAYRHKRPQAYGGVSYPCVSTDLLKTLPVPSIAADTCVLFLWVTMPMMPDALDLVRAWGFVYKTCAFVWIKQNRSGSGVYTGVGGSYTCPNAELCLVATRTPHSHRARLPPRLSRSVKQVVMAPVGRHSQKPLEVKDRITSLFGGARIELFARVPRYEQPTENKAGNKQRTEPSEPAGHGWDHWGDGQ